MIVNSLLLLLLFILKQLSRLASNSDVAVTAMLTVIVVAFSEFVPPFIILSQLRTHLILYYLYVCRLQLWHFVIVYYFYF